jgi:hypothetical protein
MSLHGLSVDEIYVGRNFASEDIMVFWSTNDSRKIPKVGDDMHLGNLMVLPAGM